MSKKSALKEALIQRGMAVNTFEAERLILARKVYLDNELVTSGNVTVSEAQKLSLKEDKKYFSRAGQKLDHALQTFSILATDKICADVGASTGGFTGVLLRDGATKVYAIDVARGEIAWALRSDSRVILMEKTNARDLEALPEKIDLVTIDVSFISLDLILPNVRKWLAANASVVALIKPQFEAPRELVERGGIIRNPETHELVIQNFKQTAETLGYQIAGLCPSPIEGAEGNKEFLVWLKLR